MDEQKQSKMSHRPWRSEARRIVAKASAAEPRAAANTSYFWSVE